MPEFICPHDKQKIEEYLRLDPYLNLYSIGDLDDFFWPYTLWYARQHDSVLRSIVLLYVGQELPALLALSHEIGDVEKLLRSIIHLLPCRFYTHLSPGLERVFDRTWKLDSHGVHCKMALRNPERLDCMANANAKRLTILEVGAIETLYRESYPGNWFDRRMLETGQYFGLWDEGNLVSVAGVHVYSEKYRVAALGNITTRPSHRNRGLARLVTEKLCQSLLEGVDHIGLNVKADNAAAISCYEDLGFETVAFYEEFLVEKNQ